MAVIRFCNAKCMMKSYGVCSLQWSICRHLLFFSLIFISFYPSSSTPTPFPATTKANGCDEDIPSTRVATGSEIFQATTGMIMYDYETSSTGVSDGIDATSPIGTFTGNKMTPATRVFTSNKVTTKTAVFTGNTATSSAAVSTDNEATSSTEVFSDSEATSSTGVSTGNEATPSTGVFTGNKVTTKTAVFTGKKATLPTAVFSKNNTIIKTSSTSSTGTFTGNKITPATRVFTSNKVTTKTAVSTGNKAIPSSADCKPNKAVTKKKVSTGNKATTKVTVVIGNKATPSTGIGVDKVIPLSGFTIGNEETSSIAPTSGKAKTQPSLLTTGICIVIGILIVSVIFVTGIIAYLFGRHKNLEETFKIRRGRCQVNSSRGAGEDECHPAGQVYETIPDQVPGTAPPEDVTKPQDADSLCVYDYDFFGKDDIVVVNELYEFSGVTNQRPDRSTRCGSNNQHFLVKETEV
ncbi:uncharacterized protein [Diadema antillarum]|uniref:uncharacterized protein n=1 Tax=Diadema antillarum TaxID=105358 RepID=UPI003A87BB00